MKKSTLTPTDELQANHPDTEDIGPISLEVKRDETKIHLEFGKPVEWLRFTPDVARATARQLVMLADEIDGEQTQGAEATGDVICIACGYAGDIETFPPAMSVYQDIRCPKCGSTNNEHNSEYQTRLMQRMRESR